MTIKKGEEWGRPMEIPDVFAVFSTDAELARHPSGAPAALLAGDLWCAVGRPSLVTPPGSCTELPVDAMDVTITRSNGTVVTTKAASSVEMGTWFSPRGYRAVLNNGFLRGRNLTPRSHPNDGRFEVFELNGNASFMQRFLILRRARTGSHLPHPEVTVSSVQSARFERSSRRAELRIDGRRVRRWNSVTVDSVPDHWRLLL